MARKIKICTEEGCNNPQTSKDYCRLHYMIHWKEQKKKEKAKEAKRLKRYVEGIMRRNPDGSEAAQKAKSPTDESDGLMDEVGYTEPEGLDEIISNLKLDR